MSPITVFFRQAELLLTTLPLIHTEEVFALKGGTAINFFVRELPRLSVEAPRDTLYHHYWTDEQGMIEKVNLIVATGQNN